ncbi:MAG: ribonuclease III [Lachnospiraceae bacterium]|nr:ribonuclease III [Lachnospiraceae bacterium]
MNNYSELEKQIEYKFKDISHLETAFTHKSYTNEIMIGKKESYERYEFLGDAILEYVVSNYLFTEYPDMSEGDLTKLRASLVCEFTLSKISRDLKLGTYGYFSKGEKHTGGQNRDSILCDMFESLIGAMYLDGGIEASQSFIKKYLLTDIEHKKLYYDSKTKLQEVSQKEDKALKYNLLSEEGPEHDKTFHVNVSLGDEIIADGKGHSKKTAEQTAAFNALKNLGLI